MSTALVAINQDQWTPEKVDLLKRTICKGATDDELQLFLGVCKRTGLDPFTKQIHAVRRWNKKENRFDFTFQVGIDGFRLIAERTGKYAGSDDPVFDDEADPKKATVTVYKMVSGTRCPFPASARWSEYFPGDKEGFMWRKMPCLMLGKVAESLALRKAFPAELSGLYTNEEMAQAGRARVAPDRPGPEDGAKPAGPSEYIIPQGTYARKRVHEIPPTELRALKERLESDPSLEPWELKLLERVSEFVTTLDNMDPSEPESGGIEEFVKCTCGSDLTYSERKGVYYCPQFRAAGEHIKPLGKTQYEKGVAS